MTTTEIERLAELESEYIKCLSGYDGHGMYPGLPRHLAQELFQLRQKRDCAGK